jgi:hypothetical protein
LKVNERNKDGLLIDSILIFVKQDDIKKSWFADAHKPLLARLSIGRQCLLIHKACVQFIY